MNENLRPIREKRKKLSEIPEEVERILKEGAVKAGKVAKEVLEETMRAVRLR